MEAAPWEEEDVLWQNHFRDPVDDPSPAESWARWAAGGDYAPEDGGGRWQHPLELNVRSLHVFGIWRSHAVLWPKGELPRDILYNIYSVILWLLLGWFMVSHIMNLKYNIHDLGRLTDIIMIIAVTSNNGTKMLPMVFGRRRVERCLYLMRAALRLGPPLETRSGVIEKFRRQMRIGTTMMYFSAVCTVVTWLGAPLLTLLLHSLSHGHHFHMEFNVTTAASVDDASATTRQPLSLPFAGWFPMDTRDPSARYYFNYALGYLLQALGSSIDTMWSASSNLFWMGMLHGGCVALRLLRASLRELSPDAQPSPDAYLAMCIRQHQAVLSFVRELSELLGPVILVESLDMIVMLCSIVFHATTLSAGNFKIVSTIGFLFYEMGELLLLCYFASELMWECEQVANDVYFSQWFACGTHTRRSVYFLMLRAYRPSVINVAGFTVLGLDLFSALLRASYSLLALLNSSER